MTQTDCCAVESAVRTGKLQSRGFVLFACLLVVLLIVLWTYHLRLPLRGGPPSEETDSIDDVLRKLKDGKTVSGTAARATAANGTGAGESGGGAPGDVATGDGGGGARVRRSDRDEIAVADEPLFRSLEPWSSTAGVGDFYAYRLLPSADTGVHGGWLSDAAIYRRMLALQHGALRYVCTTRNNDTEHVDTYIRAVRVLRDFARRFARDGPSGALRRSDMPVYYGDGAMHFAACMYHAYAIDSTLFALAREALRRVLRETNFRREHGLAGADGGTVGAATDFADRLTNAVQLDPITLLRVADAWVLGSTGARFAAEKRRVDAILLSRRNECVKSTTNVPRECVQPWTAPTRVFSWWTRDASFRDFLLDTIRVTGELPSRLIAQLQRPNGTVAPSSVNGASGGGLAPAWLSLASISRDPSAHVLYRDGGRLLHGRYPYYGDLWLRFLHSDTQRRLNGTVRQRTAAQWNPLRWLAHTQVRDTCANLFGPGSSVPGHWTWPKTLLGLGVIPSIGLIRMYAQRYAFWARIMKPDLPFYTYAQGEFDLCDMHTAAQFRFFAQLGDDALAKRRAFQPGSLVLDGETEQWVLANCNVSREQDGVISLYPISANGTVMASEQIGIINQRYEMFRGFFVEEFGLLDYRNSHAYSLITVKNRTGRKATYYTSSHKGDIVHRVDVHATIYAEANFDDPRLSARLLCKPMDFNAFLAQTELNLHYDKFFADGHTCYALDVEETGQRVSVLSRDNIIDVPARMVARDIVYEFSDKYNQYVNVLERSGKTK